jgi:hypothetical protein
VKTLIAAGLLLALIVPAAAETCTGRVKIDAMKNELAGGRIAYVGECMFLPEIQKRVLRSCPAGSYCRVEGVSYGEGEVGPEINAFTSVKQVLSPYQEGVRDWREGQCFRARPYLDNSLVQEAWIRGYHAGAKKYPKRDMAHCHLGSIKGLN